MAATFLVHGDAAAAKSFDVASSGRARRPEGVAGLERSKVWKNWILRKKLFLSRNTLKTHKTANERFANVWQKQTFICKILGKKLGIIWRAGALDLSRRRRKSSWILDGRALLALGIL